MLKISNRKHQSHKASQCSVDKRKAAQHEKYIIEINQTMMQINDDELQLVYQDIIQQSNSQEKNKVECHQKLIDFVKKLPDNHLKSAINLFDTMRYTKGQNKGNLLSPFLQNKALNFINSSLYKVGQDSDSLIRNNKALKNKLHVAHIVMNNFEESAFGKLMLVGFTNCTSSKSSLFGVGTSRCIQQK
ncbi:hypothetical protein C2G38_2027374 [Gigaspora rosea]|uniref:Uncharacterized protein n=1 Tax=Gigaspora rosea TaxID=44941 RepID=A0A397W8C8_9GLOM|nr:hypothetical protein C2G38_2027374 [Gigaspora rosea]